ncbi:hypothetical protein Tco_0196858 [Tanacetum coccineum]
MDIGGSSYDVSGNVIVKRQCIQQPDFRQETLGQIGSIEHQQRSTREVDPASILLSQLKKANASLTQELKECKTNLDETSRALGEATSSRDSCLMALQTKQTELEKYTALNDRTSDYKILQTKLNETLGLLTRKVLALKYGDISELH